MNTAIANTNETVVLGQSDDLHGWSKICESVVVEDLLSASNTNRSESYISLKIDSYKWDPDRSLAPAKEFVLLGSYQRNIRFPTSNHHHFCHIWYQFYSILEFSDMTINSYCFVCHFPYLKDRFEKVFTTDGFDN